MTARGQVPSVAMNHWLWGSLVVGSAAAVAGVIGATFSPTDFFRAYLFAYVFFLGLPLGSLALIMIYHLTGGAWGLLIRRIVEAQMLTLPLIALLFLPLCFGLSHVYPWATSLVGTTEAQQSVQERYLEPTSFYWRAGIYFAVWLTLSTLLTVWARHYDRTDDVRTAWKCYKLSGFGLVLLGITLHFAAVDWLMSLQTDFTSTIFGPLVFSGQILSAFSAAVVVLCLLSNRPEYERLLSSKVLNDLGSLLFTLLLLWAYMAWFQFMLIWMADLPRGSVWYLPRMREGWQWFLPALLVFHFVVPFFALLFRGVKRRPRLLGSVAALILTSQLFFDYYQVLPAFDRSSMAHCWLDAVLPMAFGGLWLANFLWQLSRQPLLPRCDLNYPQAILLRDLESEEFEREQVLVHG